MDSTTLPRFHVDPKWWVLISVGVSSFMSALDGSVVNIILPVVNQSFRASVAQVEWIVTIYLLVLSGLLLSFGRLGDMRSHRSVFLAGFFVFVLSSAACGLAPTVPILILFRAIQATGAAMISSNAPAILTRNFPAEQRGQVLGLQATMTYLGLTIGPTLGGWLAQFTWRAVFYINVPIGLLAILLSARFIPVDQFKEKVERFDFWGAFLFIAGLSALLLGLNQGHEWGWTSIPIIALLAVAIFLLALFIWVESKVPDPMLDLSLFRRPIFSLSTLSAVLNYICIYTILFLMPFYLIDGRAFGSSQAGLILTAQPIVMAIIAPISGTLSDRVGARWPGMIGMALLSVGLWLLSRLASANPIFQVVLALGIAGFGTGSFISPNTSALLGAAPRHQQGIAAGMLATARNFGMVLGVGLAGAIYTTILAQAGASGSNSLALYQACQTTFLVATGLAAVGIFTTGMRG